VTKLVGEWLVRAVGRAHGMGTISMSYFNVAGAAEPELADHGRLQPGSDGLRTS